MAERDLEVDVTFTAEGLDAVRKSVTSLKTELEGLGIDSSALSGFDRLDSAVNRTAKSMKSLQSGAKGAGDAAKAAAEGPLSAWDALQKEMAEANAEYTKFLQGKVTGTGGGTALDQFDTNKLAQFSAASKITTNQLVKDFDSQASGARNAATATGELAGGMDKLSVSAERYASYDAAATFGAIGVALTSAAAYAVKAGATFESAFTAVERTSGVTGDAAKGLKNDLLDLAHQIPQTFEELSEIASGGAQMGIASDQLAGFTDTIAKFVATSDTVDADAAVAAFGKLSNLTGTQDWNALGSAITLVGVNAAATEAQIIKTAQEIAPFGVQAGMQADQIIGLSAALASLAVPPERARSAISSLSSVVDKAVAGLNDKLPKYAELLGISTEATKALWDSDSTAFVEQMARALAESKNMTVSLSELGLSEKRVSATMAALANDAKNATNGLSVLEQANADAIRGFAEGTEMQTQFGLIADDLSTRWQTFANSIREVAASIGSSLAPAIGRIMGVLQGLVAGISDFLATPFGQGVAAMGLAVAALAGGLASLVAVVLLARGSLLAMEMVNKALSLTNIAVAASEAYKANGFRASAAAAWGAVTATQAYKVALASIGVGVALLAIGGLISAFVELGNSMKSAAEKGKAAWGNDQELSSALIADTKAVKEGAVAYQEFQVATSASVESMPTWISSVESATGGSVALADGMAQVTEKTGEATLALGDQSKLIIANMLANDESVQAFIQSLQGLDPENLPDTDRFFKALTEGNLKEAKQAIVDFGEAQKKAASEMGEFGSTLIDSDALSALSDMQNAFDAVQERIANASDTAAASVFLSGSLGVGIDEATGKMIVLDDELAYGVDVLDDVNRAAEEAFNKSDVMANFAGNLDSLFQGIIKGGGSFDYLTEAGRNNLNNLQKGVAGTIAAAQNAGVGSAEAIALVFMELQRLGGDTSAAMNAIDFGAFNTSASQVLDYMNGVTGFSDKALEIAASIDSISISAYESVKSSESNSTATRKNTAATQANTAAKKEAKAATDAVTAANERAKKVYDELIAKEKAELKVLEEIADKAHEAADAFRTTADYASDLGAIFSRGFDLRFGVQSQTDSIQSTVNAELQRMKDAQDAATTAATRYNEVLREQAVNAQGLTASRLVKQHWLDVAKGYGDTIRAAQLVADIAKIDEDIAASSKAVADAKADEKKASDDAASAGKKNTKGTADNNIDARKTVEDLTGQYQDLITEYANAGLTGDKLKTKVGELQTAFKDQLTQMGYTKGEAQGYADKLGEVKGAIDLIPTNITTTFNTNPMKLAIAEFRTSSKLEMAAAAADMNVELKKVKIDKIPAPTIGKPTIPKPDAPSMPSIKTPTIGKPVIPKPNPLSIPNTTVKIFSEADKASIRTAMGRLKDMYQAQLNAQYKINGGNSTPATRGLDNAIAQIQGVINRNWWTGGFTGRGGKYESAGQVHRGEYVVPKKHVDQRTGIPDMGYVQSLQGGRQAPQIAAGYSGGGFVGGLPTGGVMELGPASLAWLRDNLNNGSLYADSREIARAGSAGDRALARSGSN